MELERIYIVLRGVKVRTQRFRVSENVIIKNLPKKKYYSSEETKERIREIGRRVSGFNPVRLHELLTKQYGADKYSLQSFKNKLYVLLPFSTQISDLDFLVAFQDERNFANEVVHQKINNTLTNALKVKDSKNANESFRIDNIETILFEDDPKTINPHRESPESTFEQLKTVLTSQDTFVNLGNKKPMKIKRTLNLTSRDTNLVKEMKSLYDNNCQVCGKKIQIGVNEFASELHHIRPLGKHNGSDTSDNVIVLCPNHHLMFDRGAITIDIKQKKVYHNVSNHLLNEQDILLKHRLDEKNISYHNENIYRKYT
jgi:hypothetical protein